MSGESNQTGTRDGLGGQQPLAPSPPGQFAAKIMAHLVVLAVFVGFPAVWTAMAPVSWIKFERHDGRVSARARTCLLLVIPYDTVTVDSVVSISDRIVPGEVTRQSRNGRMEETKSEDTGYLLLNGGAEIPVSPFSLESVVDRSRAFLKDSQRQQLRMFVVANWKFSFLAGVPLSLLAALYVGAIVLASVQRVVHVCQSAIGVPPEERWLEETWRRIVAAIEKRLGCSGQKSSKTKRQQAKS